MKHQLFLWYLLGFSLCAPAHALKICAFNVRSFGAAKASNQRVMDILKKIIARYDLCLIQEVRDAKGGAIPALVKELNRFNKSHVYAHVQSQRLGRSSYKEQYVFIYRSDVVQVKEYQHYPELKEDNDGNDTHVFTREPFVASFHSPNTLLKDFILVGQHTCPKNAMKEIEGLHGVVLGVCKRWKTQNVMLLGDLNAACGYITVKNWSSLRLRKDPEFHWLIGDHEDTTVREKTHCAYDRIVVHGTRFLSAIIPHSARPFNFKEEFQLTEEEALQVSDHFPVEVDLKASHRYHLRHEL